MKKSRSGFTIVELLIVVVVIAILAAISAVAYTGIQDKARDAERKSDIGQLHKALEAFYAVNGYYPAVHDVLNATYRRDTLKIPEGIVTAPNSSLINYCWSANPNNYCYVGRAASGGSFDCTTSGEHCVGYYISYRLESSPDVRIDKRSLNFQ